MQSLILISKDIQKLKDEALNLAKKEKVSKFDVDITETEKALGIGDIRNIQKKIFLTPVSGDRKAVIVQAFYGATPDAQNAFLKLLEEPPQSAIIIVLVTSVDFLLPTILSRCTVINLDKQRKLSQEQIIKNLAVLNNEIRKNALKLAQDNSKDKETALIFLEDLIITAEENLEEDISLGKKMKMLQKTHTIIKTTNVNPRFALENLFLNI
jgi:DNA polymerase III gamma/tau subunit